MRAVFTKIIRRTKKALKAGLSGNAVKIVPRTALGDLRPVSERDVLVSLMQEKESVDLVRAEDAYLWIYRNDNFYKQLSNQDKNLNRQSLKSLKASVPNEPQFTALRHILSIEKGAAIFDIGCNYGREAVRIRRILDAEGAAGPLFMFDPGVAGKLAHLNMLLNGLTGFEYYNIAISDIDGHVLVHLVSGQSQDNKIINRRDDAISIPVRAMRLDSFVKDRIPSPSACFMKCDTQGAEFEVLRGFEKSALYHRMAGVIEFFPNGLATRIRPAVFAEKLCRDFSVYDLGPHRRFFYPVSPDNLESLFARIEKFNPPYTDLLLISKGLPGESALKRRLMKEFGERRDALSSR
ncbi:MAG: FkbM family methyltransferase [Pseudomonadota bacterium]